MSRLSWLEETLRAHVPADPTERAHVQHMLALLGGAGDPFARDHWAPGHFTASAFVLSPPGDALLLILHGKLARWLQPGGHVDADDTDLVATARREVREETGVGDLALIGAGAFDADVHEIPARKRDPAHQHFDLRFLFRASTSALAAASDADAAKWIPISEVASMDTDESVLRAVRKIAARGASAE